jgi:hypothetical protein
MAQKLVVGSGLVNLTPEEQARIDASIVGKLDRLKQMKKAEVNEERGERLSTLTVDLDGMTFDADAQARESIMGTVSAINSGVIPVPDPISWRDVNNVTQSLTHLKLLELAGLIFAAVQTVYQTSWTLKSNVDAAGTIEAVNAITWA